MEPVPAETAEAARGPGVRQLVQISVALHGVLHVSQDSGGPLVQVRNILSCASYCCPNSNFVMLYLLVDKGDDESLQLFEKEK